MPGRVGGFHESNRQVHPHCRRLAGNRHPSHYAMDNDLTLEAAALKLGFVTEAEFDHVVPKKMVCR
jgi:hypothetical protein